MNVPFFELESLHVGIRNELDAVWESTAETGHFIGGRAVEEFEEKWAAYCGSSHAVAVANGTDALQLTLLALGVGRGDEVIVPANTFVATPEAVSHVGARPVFVDVDPVTLLITGDHVRAALTERTAAVIAVHLYGNPVDMDEVGAVAEGAGVALIEDAAQAHGATWKGQRTGSLSRAGCFSFYPGKNLGAFGDAGAVVTNDAELSSRIRRLRNHGREGGSGSHELVGVNSRLDALQAAILSVKLAHLDAWNQSRQEAASAYAELLGEVAVDQVPPTPGSDHVYHLEVVRTPRRREVMDLMAAQGVETRIHYPVPCHLEPAFAALGTTTLPVVERAAGEIVSLPMFPHITEPEIKAVVAALAEALDQAD